MEVCEFWLTGECQKTTQTPLLKCPQASLPLARECKTQRPKISLLSKITTFAQTQNMMDPPPVPYESMYLRISRSPGRGEKNLGLTACKDP